MRLGILGGGRAAWAFGSAWKRIGWPLSGVWLRNESRSAIAELLATPRTPIETLARHSDLLLVAVSDRAIEDVANAIPPTGATIFHASGALLSVRGGFSLHPLKSLPPVGAPSDLDDTLLVFEGEHRDIARKLADAVGARFAVVAAEQKPRYHAAAVFGANYVAAMLDTAERLMTEAGVSGVREELVALAGSAIENWRRHTDARRFTGPAARGDRDVLARHAAALADDPELARLYDLVAEQIARALTSGGGEE